MGFFKGRASFLRLTPGDAAFSEFTQDHLDMLTAYATPRETAAATHYTWGGGDHSRDSTFSLEKNVVGGALSFDLVVITDRPPPELLQSYYAIELKALSASNPSGFASAKQKREARERARERIEDEARDGRFRRRKCIPIIWDLEHGEILYGATSLAHLGAFTGLFLATFDVSLDVITPEQSAVRIHSHCRRFRSRWVETPTGRRRRRIGSRSARAPRRDVARFLNDYRTVVFAISHTPFRFGVACSRDLN